jgi:hypothetical protein
MSAAEIKEPRVPDLDRIRKVRDVDWAAAIRAAEWLAQHFSDPHRPAAWQERYKVLRQFLYATVGASLFYHALSVREDLEALERVLDTLLPASFWTEYREDIQHLRKQGLPLRLSKGKANPLAARGRRSRRCGCGRQCTTYRPLAGHHTVIRRGFGMDHLGPRSTTPNSSRTGCERVTFGPEGRVLPSVLLSMGAAFTTGISVLCFPGPFRSALNSRNDTGCGPLIRRRISTGPF